MSNPYIQTEVKKVLDSNDFPQNTALAAAWVIAHFKGLNIKIIDVCETSSLCDYNIIASTENIIQAKSMSEEITSNLKQQADMDVISVEGLADGEWILIDLGDIIVHIFQDVSRSTYDLDSLWSESPLVTIPQEFYFGAGAEAATTPGGSTENYF